MSRLLVKRLDMWNSLGFTHCYFGCWSYPLSDLPFRGEIDVDSIQPNSSCWAGICLMQLGCPEVGASIAPHSWLSDTWTDVIHERLSLQGKPLPGIFLPGNFFAQLKYLSGVSIPPRLYCATFSACLPLLPHVWCKDLLPISGYRETTKGGMTCFVEEYKLRMDRLYLNIVFRTWVSGWGVSW